MSLTSKPRVVYKMDSELIDMSSITFEYKPLCNWPTRKLSCSVCHRKFHLLTTLNLHKKVHFRLKPYACASCFTQFPTKTLLQRHSSSHINVTEPSCFLCKKFFSNYTSLKTHEFFMPCVKPFECNKCVMKFRCKAMLWHHQKLHKIQNKETVFHCRTCDKNFHLKGTFFVHQRWHDRQPQLYCKLCRQNFYLKSSAIAHRICHSLSS